MEPCRSSGNSSGATPADSFRGKEARRGEHGLLRRNVCLADTLLFPSCYPPCSGHESLLETVTYLLAYDAAAADPQDPSRPAPPTKRRRTTSQEEMMHVRRLSVDVRLQASDARRTLAGVLPVVRTAWRTGAPFPGCNRVQVFASRCDGLSGFAAEKELYEEGKEWWDGGTVDWTTSGRSDGPEEVNEEA